MNLGKLGLGNVSPNPLVGCVIVLNDYIIGEGWHKKLGEHHAEINAIQDVANKATLSEATLYVNLEPCNHTGATPPCTEAIIEHNIKRVVIANEDPNPKVDGKGIVVLQKAGIDVLCGCLKQQGEELNKRFFTFHQKKRPYIILKWAQTADGYMAKDDYTSKWISNKYARRIAHQWRSEEDAVLVGTRTVKYDNPKLTTRMWSGKNPIRIVIDKKGQLASNCHIFDQSTPTICYNTTQSAQHTHLHFVQLPNKDFTNHMLKDMFQRNIQSLMIEGGPYTLNEFMTSNLWDESRVCYAPKNFGKGINAPKAQGRLVKSMQLNDNNLSIYVRK